MKLRDYQREALRCVAREWAAGKRSTLVVMATGLGKTVTFAGAIHDHAFPDRAMVLAHREELITQAADKIHRVTGLECGIEMADLRTDEQGLFGRVPVVVSSVQTQNAGGDGGGRMSRFDPAEFGVLIVDEAHHATAGTYRRVMNYYQQNERCRTLGVTATPDRADEEELGQVFDSVAYVYELADAIRDGWLVPISQQFVAVEGLDFSQMRTTAGDLNGADLAEILEMERNLHGMAAPVLDIAGARRGVIFCVSVKQAEAMAEIMNRHKAGCAGWVCGATPKEDRKKVLADFAAGRVQFMCNCGVLTEGFDDPGVELIVMGRPTKSRALYAQMVGRGTRPLPGVVDGLDGAGAERVAAIAASAKAGCLVLDFVGNSGRHKLVSTMDLLGGNYSEEIQAATLRKAQLGGGPCDMTADLEAEQERVNAEREARRLEAAARLMKLTAQAKYKVQSVDPFDVFNLTPQAERGWDAGKKLSPKQREILAKQGIDADSMPYSQAKQLLNETFRRWDEGLCSFKQAKLLQKNGLPADLPMGAAKAAIDAIVSNNWKAPADIQQIIARAGGGDAVPF